MPTCSDPIKEAERRRGISVSNKGKHTGMGATPEAEAERRRKISKGGIGKHAGKGGWPKGRPKPFLQGKNNPAKRPEVKEKRSFARKGKPNPEGSVSLRGFYQTKAGLRKRFLQGGNLNFRIPWWKLLWRKFLWWFWYRRRSED